MKTMMKNEKHETQNLYEGSYLYAKGFKLVGVTKGIKATLIFSGDGVIEASLDYYNEVGKVSPKKLFDSYRTLKDMVFQR